MCGTDASQAMFVHFLVCLPKRHEQSLVFHREGKPLTLAVVLTPAVQVPLWLDSSTPRENLEPVCYPLFCMCMWHATYAISGAYLHGHVCVAKRVKVHACIWEGTVGGQLQPEKHLYKERDAMLLSLPLRMFSVVAAGL